MELSVNNLFLESIFKYFSKSISYIVVTFEVYANNLFMKQNFLKTFQCRLLFIATEFSTNIYKNITGYSFN